METAYLEQRSCLPGAAVQQLLTPGKQTSVARRAYPEQRRRRREDGDCLPRAAAHADAYLEQLRMQMLTSSTACHPGELPGEQQMLT